jgi:hypothetical protein
VLLGRRAAAPGLFLGGAQLRCHFIRHALGVAFGILGAAQGLTGFSHGAHAGVELRLQLAALGQQPRLGAGAQLLLGERLLTPDFLGFHGGGTLGRVYFAADTFCLAGHGCPGLGYLRFEAFALFLEVHLGVGLGTLEIVHGAGCLQVLALQAIFLRLQADIGLLA